MFKRHITKDEQSKIALNGDAYDFSVGYNSIKKEDILNIHQHLMVENNIR